MNAIIGMSTIAAKSIGDDDQVADCISKIGISSRFLDCRPCSASSSRE